LLGYFSTRTEPFCVDEVAAGVIAVEAGRLKRSYRNRCQDGPMIFCRVGRRVRRSPIAVALCAYFLGTWLVQYEPVAWVEELIDAERALGHRRLAQLYVAGAQCYAAGRVHGALGYLEASQQIAKSGDFDPVPYELQNATGVVYAVAGQPERWADLCRNAIAGEAGPHTVTRACLVTALYALGQGDEARVASEGLLAAAEATDNPNTACFALMAYSTAHQNADPVAAYDVLRRALTVARESENRQLE
jgi:hypothetical protein